MNNLLFSKGERLYSILRKKIYVVTKIESSRIRVLLEGSTLRYWVSNYRARQIFISAEAAAQQGRAVDGATAPFENVAGAIRTATNA